MKKALFLLTALLLFIGDVKSQTIDPPTTTGCYRQPVEMVFPLPTYHTDMPLNTLLGYVYFDSLMRSLNDSSFRALLKAKISEDSLRILMKYVYAMQNYDPNLFQQYSLFGKFKNPLYYTAPGLVVEALSRNLAALHGWRSQEMSLWLSTQILQIHVQSVSSDSEVGSIVGPETRCITAFVDDTIKGKKYIHGDCAVTLPASDSLAGSPCINLSYSPTWPKGQAGSHVQFTNPNMLLGDSLLLPGRNYVVFLYSHFLDYDGSVGYWDYVPLRGSNMNGGVFPIIEGVVQDKDNFWGFGTTVPLDTFKSGLRAKISTFFLNP